MFSITDSIKYGWAKMKENMQFVLLSTLILGIIAVASGMEGIVGFLLVVLGVVVRIGYTKAYLRLNDGEKPKLEDLFGEIGLPWNVTFWKYIGVSILQGLVIIGGLILLILPGFYWAVRFAFSPIILIDTKGGIVASMKESYAITKGNFWNLLGFWFIIGLINIIGFLLLGVGTLFSFPISTFAAIQVYRKLSAAKAAVGTPTPVAPAVQ